MNNDYMQGYDAREIANFLLDYADQKAVGVSNMSLLKQIYFAHSYYLVTNKKPLIKNDIEAWEHGPVVRSVYDSFKSFGRGVITERAK